MKNTSNMTKLFGALVLGGGVILADNSSAEPPKEKKEESTKETRSKESQTKETTVSEETPKEEFCQLEFTHIQYSRDGETETKTCLDGKTDEDILKIINEAKKNTCNSPFCGCWLG